MFPDFFDANEVSAIALTAAINDTPRVPGKIFDLFDWNHDGVVTRDVSVKHVSGVLDLIDDVPVGSDAPVASGPQDDDYLKIGIPRYPLKLVVKASEVAGILAMPEDRRPMAFQTFVRTRLAEKRRSFDLLRARQAVAAVTGKLVRFDGKVRFDWFDVFGVGQVVIETDITAKGNLAKALEAAKEHIEATLGMDDGALEVSRGLMGAAFAKEARNGPEFAAAYERYQEGALLRQDNRKGFSFRDVDMVNMGADARAGAGGIAANECYVAPVLPDFYQVRYAPTDTIAAVGTPGLPLYVSREPLPHGKGLEFELESNAIAFAKRPGSIVKIVHTPA